MAVGHELLVCPLQVPIRIVQIDSSTYGGESAEPSVVDMTPEGLSPQQAAELGPAKVHMLYRPGGGGGD